MTKIDVPRKFRPQLVKLASFKDDQVNDLCKLLESHPEILTSRSAARAQAETLTKFKPGEGHDLLEAVIPLMYFKASHAESIDNLVNGIAAALKIGDKNDEILSNSQAPKFRKNLKRVLALSAVAQRAKALSVASDSQRLFSESRILSDLRPVFGEQVSEAPLGVVMLHRLKIEYAENGEAKEFFVTLDSTDLKELGASVVRAQEKEVSLRRVLEQSKLELFENRD